MDERHTHINAHFPSKPNVLQVKSIWPVLSRGKGVRGEISGSMSAGSWTDSAVCAGSSIKHVSTHVHAVLSHHNAVSFFFFILTLLDV